VRALAEVAIALGLMVINGFLAVPGFAMMSSRRGGRPDSPAAAIGAGVAVRRLGDPTTFLSIVQVRTTLVGILAGASGGATLGAHLARALNTAACRRRQPTRSESAAW
jgi:CBS domain containing-hemolysin-like protein